MQATASNTPDTRSIGERAESATTADDEPGDGEDSAEQSTSTGSTVVPATSSDVQTEDAGTKKQQADKPSVEAKKDSNLIGKINNLVTADLNTMEGGQTFILVGTFSEVSGPGLVSTTDISIGFFTPFAITFSIAFLYILLGWRYVLLVSRGTRPLNCLIVFL